MATREDLQRKLDELKAKAALPALSTEEEELEKLRADIAKADARVKANAERARVAKENDLYERLEGKYGADEIRRIDSEAGMIVLRRPSYSKARAFQKVVLKQKFGPDDIEEFVKPSIVAPVKGDTLEPDLEAVDDMLEKHAMLGSTLCSFAVDFASAGAKVREGKS